MAASGNISVVFKEPATASEKILRKKDYFWNLLKEESVLLKDTKKKMCSCLLLELCPLKEYFEVKTV